MLNVEVTYTNHIVRTEKFPNLIEVGNIADRSNVESFKIINDPRFTDDLMEQYNETIAKHLEKHAIEWITRGKPNVECEVLEKQILVEDAHKGYFMLKEGITITIVFASITKNHSVGVSQITSFVAENEGEVTVAQLVFKALKHRI